MARAIKRSDIWTVSKGPDYTGKPRPAVIVQDDHFDTDSVTICPFTTDPTDAPLIRLEIQPTEDNGLHQTCRLMIDKITTIPRTKIGDHIGALDDTNMIRLNRALIVFLGVAASP